MALIVLVTHLAGLEVLYGLFWGGLARAVKNAFGNSSIANGILLVACGIGLVIPAPSAVAKGAAFASPVPPCPAPL